MGASLFLFILRGNSCRQSRAVLLEGTYRKQTTPGMMFTCNTLVSEKLPHHNGVTRMQAFDRQDDFRYVTESWELRVEQYIFYKTEYKLKTNQ
jgi:hypothetical protein